MGHRFSGHESFICRHNWPKKAYDHISNGLSFNDADAIVRLGVGKNMVGSMNFWSKALGIINGGFEAAPMFEEILRDDGLDPYIEDIGTVWLFHYCLVRSNYASIYNLFFNDFKRYRNEFRKDHFVKYILQKYSGEKAMLNENTIDKDAQVMLRSYRKPDFKNRKLEYEEEFSGLFMDLNLVHEFKSRSLEDHLEDWYKIEVSERESLPCEILLTSILLSYHLNEISFKELENGLNSPGQIFVLSQLGLSKKLKEIEEKFPSIVFTGTAGNQVLSIIKRPDVYEILRKYYKA